MFDHWWANLQFTGAQARGWAELGVRGIASASCRNLGSWKSQKLEKGKSPPFFLIFFMVKQPEGSYGATAKIYRKVVFETSLFFGN